MPREPQDDETEIVEMPPDREEMGQEGRPAREGDEPPEGVAVIDMHTGETIFETHIDPKQTTRHENLTSDVGEP